MRKKNIIVVNIKKTAIVISDFTIIIRIALDFKCFITRIHRGMMH